LTATTPLDAQLQPMQPRRVASRAGGGLRDPGDRNPGLDLLRVVACLLVVAFHLRTVLHVDFGPFNSFVQGGDSGVYIFFALSGYLLYRPYLRGPVDLDVYALKRLARILPGYLVALISLAVLTGSALPRENPLAYVSMTAPYTVELRGFLGNAWTLSAEILFYACLPVLARLVAGAPIPRLSIVALASVVANLVYFATYGPLNAWFIGAFPIVLYAFVPGMLLAVIEARDPALFRRFASRWVAVAGVLAVVIQTQVPGGFPIAIGPGLGAVLLIGWLAGVRVSYARALTFAGGASYAMYLWHKDLFLAFGVLGLLIALAGSAASWAFVERPILEAAHRMGASWGRRRPGELTFGVSALTLARPTEAPVVAEFVPIEAPVPVSSR
jgi:peptidoglycan/LPS O-acetylase OafA/YrhL